jgi:putative Ca2+/H+ antiporter (TMEM165/GDT1 family)
MSPAVVAATFPVIFLGELPDKTMFANVLLAARGRPLAVWAGSAVAFAVHVVIAVALGSLLALAPPRAVDAVVAAVFLVGAGFVLRESRRAEEAEAGREVRRVGGRRSVLTAFAVIFLAEWGDLTQILTANLAARYHDPVGVAVGAVAALWIVGAIGVAGGRLLTRLPMAPVRLVTVTVLVALAVLALVAAVRGSSGLL